MIRRGFWLAIGAALGVAGYRRAQRLGRVIRPVRRAGPDHCDCGRQSHGPGQTGHTLEGQQLPGIDDAEDGH